MRCHYERSLSDWAVGVVKQYLMFIHILHLLGTFMPNGQEINEMTNP